MKREILKHLADPDTLAPPTLESADAADEVRDGALALGDKRYTIREGIPSFVSEDVREDQTVQSFGDKWDKHRYDKDHTRRFYTEWYLARFGFKTLDGLKEFLADKKLILDAGTGAGRDAANFAEIAGATDFGVDTAWHALSNAGAQPNRPAVNLVHADVNRLPFPDEFFDFINCDQVIW